MKNILTVIFGFLACIVPYVAVADGSGDITLDYTYLDEEGNQAVNQGTFNRYEGIGLSLENFRYGFASGVNVSADLKRITLNNRHLNFGVRKPGLFDIRLFNNQYRRAYDFGGSSVTRRYRTGASMSVYPHRYIKLYGGGEYTGKSGKMVDLFDPAGGYRSYDIDYGRLYYKAGMVFNYEGRMFQAEYSGDDYEDKEHLDRDQTRYRIRLNAATPVPRYEWIVLSGGFLHFDTRYDTNDFAYSANRVWSGIRIEPRGRFALNYNFVFDRASSDSDLVATDNIAHAVYVQYMRAGFLNLTVGYQNDINDDIDDEVNSDTYYLSGWYKPSARLEFRGEYGNRAEKVVEGYRLTGNEDRQRFKFSGKYRSTEYGDVKITYENKSRKNESLSSEVCFDRISLDGNLIVSSLGNLNCGYSYSIGEYENGDGTFEYNSHVIYGDIFLNEYRRFKPGFGFVYYRSKRDLDTESFNLNFKAVYRFMKDYRLHVEYNVHNFDDFLVDNQYYTANIVEISLTKNMTF